MFFAIALMCATADVNSCEAVLHPVEAYPTEKLCKESLPEHIRELQALNFELFKVRCVEMPGTKI